MEHFAIVQALCRAALLQSPTPALRRQVERLRDALKAEGASDQAAAIAVLLEGHPRAAEMVPSRLTRSALSPVGEVLTPRTPIPVDKESGNALAEVMFPDSLPATRPILGADVQAAADAVVAEWRGAERLQAGGFPPARTCLIFGAPGTGKTHLALWLAHQIGMPVVLARLDGLISSLLGTTSRNIAALFTFVARYSCVLLLDEFDAIAKLRDDPQEVGEIKRVVNTLLQHLDARRALGITIGVTNHEGLLDRAIWRRFEVQIAVGMPGPEARVAIARAYFGTLPISETLLRVIAWLTEGSSGAEIEVLVTSIRKRMLLAGDDTPPALSLVAECLAMHGGRVANVRAQVFAEPPKVLARVLTDELRLGQQAVGDLLGVRRERVNRWLRDDDAEAVQGGESGVAGGTHTAAASVGASAVSPQHAASERSESVDKSAAQHPVVAGPDAAHHAGDGETHPADDPGSADRTRGRQAATAMTATSSAGRRGARSRTG